METTLEAITRTELGKNEARRLRRRGRIPAVLYGGPPSRGPGAGLPITVDPKHLLKILRSESGVNTLISLRVNDEPTTRVLIRDYQLDPIKNDLLHADFYRVAMDHTLTVTVPVMLKGLAKGVKQQGGLLDFVHRQIELECLPGQIPEHLEVDVSELLIGQGVRLRDLGQNVPWTPVTAPETMLVHVIAPKAEAAEAPAEGAAAATEPGEPEVIKKGKAEAGEAAE